MKRSEEKCSVMNRLMGRSCKWQEVTAFSNYSLAESHCLMIKVHKVRLKIERLVDVASIGNDDGEVKKPTTRREASSVWRK